MRCQTQIPTGIEFQENAQRRFLGSQPTDIQTIDLRTLTMESEYLMCAQETSPDDLSVVVVEPSNSVFTS